MLNQTRMTLRGAFTISSQFSSNKEAETAGYSYYFTDGDVKIYIHHIDLYHCLFATVPVGNEVSLG